jgi:ribonuclease J
MLIRQKLEEKMAIKDVDLRVFNPGDIIQCGSLSVEPIRVTHSIPDSCSMAIRTEYGIVLMTSDFKFDFTPVDGKLANITRFGELSKEGVLALLSDSTNVERTGWGPSEREVSEGLRQAMLDAEGRVLLTTFASNVHRIQQFIEVAAECGRKVAVVGRRMEQNIDICTRMKYIRVPSNTLIGLDDMKRYSASQLAVLTTGSQGEPMSALVQMSKDEYGRLRIEEGDTLIYSARPIPGNEAAIWRTINRLFRQGANVVYEAPTPIHVSGHAYQEELKMMINLTRPYYVAPVHGEARHLHLYLKIAKDMGYPSHRTWLMEDGVPLCLTATKAYTDERVPCGRVLVDNSGNTGVSEEVLRDRFNLSNDGVVSVTVVIDPEQGEIVGEPILHAKGYNGTPESLDAAGVTLLDTLLGLNREELRDVDNLRHVVATSVRRHLQRKEQLRPLVLPTVVEV